MSEISAIQEFSGAGLSMALAPDSVQTTTLVMPSVTGAGLLTAQPPDHPKALPPIEPTVTEAGLPTALAPDSPSPVSRPHPVKQYHHDMKKLDEIRETIDCLARERTRYQGKQTKTSTLRRILAAKLKGHWSVPDSPAKGKLEHQLVKLAKIVKRSRAETELLGLSKKLRRMRIEERKVVEKVGLARMLS